jgi:transcriptional regulator GlxA family with amidase domain
MEIGRLPLPRSGKILVAFPLSEGATVIDFAGPWEAFEDVMLSGPDDLPFRLFTVAESLEPVTCTGGMKVVPSFTFAGAPQPNVIVVGAQSGGPALQDWLREASRSADITISVCTGAFQLARAGLLAGQTATTHHEFVDHFEKEFPDIPVKRGVRFVEAERIATSGGLTSGIDLALRVVERYFGRALAEKTAAYLEYESRGWIV